MYAFLLQDRLMEAVHQQGRPEACAVGTRSWALYLDQDAIPSS